MRREDHASLEPEYLLDFGSVPVRGDAVGLEVLVGEAEVGALRGLLAGARDARHGIDHDHAVGRNEPGAHGRGRSEGRGRRIAPGTGHERGRAGGHEPGGLRQAVGEQLGQAERRLRQKLELRVQRVVVALVHGSILQPEVGREVDHRDALVKQHRRMLQGDRVRNRQERHVEVGEVGLAVALEDQVGAAGEDGIRFGDGSAGQGVRRDGRKFETGMLKQDADKLDAGESCASDDSSLVCHANHSFGKTVSVKRHGDAAAKCERE